jgi:mono/diheme cytochrome c family protein
MTFDTTVAIVPTAGPAQAGGKINGADVFTKCAVCHQATGQGLAGAYPPLVGSEWLLNNPQVPIRIVLHGLQGQITVAGKSVNSAMTPFADLLSDAEIAAVISYERSSWGNNAAPITEAQVAAERKATASQKGPWSPADLQSLIHGK